MLALTKRGIQPLIESSQGLHVSAYIPVWSTIFELRGRLSSLSRWGDQSGFSYIDHAVYPTLSGIKLTVEGSMKWLSFVIGDLTRTFHPVLFLAGQQTMVRALIDTLDYPNLYPETLSYTFRSRMAPELCQMARAALHEESKTRVESRMAELNEAKGRGLASTDLREIASLAVKGSVKTLFIAERVQIFGRLDTESGEMVVHSGDLNHEDDDLLDDVAQLVLMKGGDVLMAPGSLLPSGTPLAAVLKREPRR